MLRNLTDRTARRCLFLQAVVGSRAAWGLLNLVQAEANEECEVVSFRGPAGLAWVGLAGDVLETFFGKPRRRRDAEHTPLSFFRALKATCPSRPELLDDIFLEVQ